MFWIAGHCISSSVVTSLLETVAIDGISTLIVLSTESSLYNFCITLSFSLISSFNLLISDFNLLISSTLLFSVFVIFSR